MVYDVLFKRGIRLNWAPHKTALLVVRAGKNKREEWRSITEWMAIPIHDQALTLVQRYKHLGSIITPDLSTSPAIKHRSSQSAYTMHAFKRFVAAKGKLDVRIPYYADRLHHHHVFDLW